MITGRRHSWTRLRAGLVIIGIPLLLLISCGRKQSQPEESGHTPPISREERARLRQEVAQTPHAPEKSWFKKAEIAVNKMPEGKIEVNVTAEITFPKANGKSALAYIYWQNRKKIKETNEPTVTLTGKKGDTLYVDILLRVNDQTIEKRQTEWIVLPNTAPELTAVDIPQISGPGTYTLPVKAEDADGDRLSYRLLPLDDSHRVPDFLRIDPRTGTVTLTLGKEPPGPSLEFIIAADDGDGGIGQKEISIPFQTKRVTEE
ncbi:MAG: cadherin repeat domain-containing protein [Candidatus Omnitrophota bacterium]